MPELPEVETTCRGIAPHVLGRRVAAVELRNRQLRWPVPADLSALLAGQQIHRIERRAKYLLLSIGVGTLIVHLGMSGSLRIVAAGTSPRKHDHIDIVLDDSRALRFHDPRRFGAMLWTEADPQQHVLLASLGPEPLGQDFCGEHLFARSRGRRAAVKTFIMDGAVVVGVGNIYANEALFNAGIRPGRAAGRVSRASYDRLAEEIRRVLAQAIAQGGTTLRDFVNASGEPGYFSQQLFVYGRGGEPCRHCGASLIETRLGQRSTVYCRHCQV